MGLKIVCVFFANSAWSDSRKMFRFLGKKARSCRVLKLKCWITEHRKDSAIMSKTKEGTAADEHEHNIEVRARNDRITSASVEVWTSTKKLLQHNLFSFSIQWIVLDCGGVWNLMNESHPLRILMWWEYASLLFTLNKTSISALQHVAKLFTLYRINSLFIWKLKPRVRLLVGGSSIVHCLVYWRVCWTTKLKNFPWKLFFSSSKHETFAGNLFPSKQDKKTSSSSRPYRRIIKLLFLL